MSFSRPSRRGPILPTRELSPIRKDTKPASLSQFLFLGFICSAIFFLAYQASPQLFHTWKDVHGWQDSLLDATRDTVSGSGSTQSSDQENIQDPHLWAQRADDVKRAFLHGWNGYKKYAWGHDEIRPETNITNDSWGGFGVTLVDGLDTMLLMGLEDEVAQAREFITNLDFDKDYDASFFETTIRYVGGLLGAHALSGDKIYLEKAQELAERLMAAFDASSSGLPVSVVNLKTGNAHNHNWNSGNSILAEVGSCQLEYTYLSFHTKDAKYYNKARTVYEILDRLEKPHVGLYPVYISPQHPDFAGQRRITYGSLSDSFYEYLLKLYILSGRTDMAALRMYLEAAEGLTTKLLHTTTANGQEYTFIKELDGHVDVGYQEHLTCFVPGLLALGASLFRNSNRTFETGEEAKLARLSEKHLELAEKTAETCYLMYRSTSTGLGPEAIDFSTKSEATGNPPWRVSKSGYFLRPELLESLFVLYRVTKNIKYREWAWNIFQSINKYCKTYSAYSGIKDVNANVETRESIEKNWFNSQQSFFFAETLKYLYLTFSPDELFSFDKFVFTTEAHPLAIIPSEAFA